MNKLYTKLNNFFYNGLDQKIEETKWEMTQTNDPREIDELNNRLKRLIETKNEERKNNISKKDIFGALVSVLGLVAIIHHEETSVIGGKAGSWIKKLF